MAPHCKILFLSLYSWCAISLMLYFAYMSPNVAIISATTAVLTLVFTTFGASWLNQRNIEKLLEQLERRFDARFDTVLTGIKRLDRIERQLEAVFKPVPPSRAS